HNRLKWMVIPDNVRTRVFKLSENTSVTKLSF
ncbi:unnamed protein product, partial [marine sediment metagenome]